MRAFEGPRRDPLKPKRPSWGKYEAPVAALMTAAECYDRATVPRQPACPIASTCATSRPAPRRWKAVGETEPTNARSAEPTLRKRSSDAQTPTPQSSLKLAVCRGCFTDLIMTRFAAVKHQRTVALAKEMNAAADEIVKLRNRAKWNKRDPAELRAEELQIREKFGLLEDTPLHDVTRRGARCYELRRATRGLVEQERAQRIAHRHLRQVGRALRQSRDGSLDRPISEPIRPCWLSAPQPNAAVKDRGLFRSRSPVPLFFLRGIGNGGFEHIFDRPRPPTSESLRSLGGVELLQGDELARTMSFLDVGVD